MEKKYMIGRNEESIVGPFGAKEYLNKEKKFIPFTLEMESMLFNNKEEANQFIVDELPDLRIRNLMREKKNIIN